MSDTPDKKPALRSAQWFGTADKNGFMYRSWMKNQGIPDHEFQGKPIIGICNTWSELTPCNAHFRQLAEHVKRGVFEAGGFPVEFPVFSNGESNLRPTAMFTRNLASMDVEEAIRGNPIDARRAADRLRQDHAGVADGRGELRRAGHRRHRRADAQRQARRQGHRFGHGRVAAARSRSRRARSRCTSSCRPKRGMSRSAGTCNTMGTASTMACMAEALGVRCRTTRRFRRSIRAATCWRTCRACASWRWSAEDLRLSKILTREARSRTRSASMPRSAARPTR